jgi:hypothetical protein
LLTVEVSAETVFDNASALLWQRMAAATPRTWAEADAYCNTLLLDGQTGWRLPRIYELVGSVDYSRARPALDGHLFPGTGLNDLWSAEADSATATNHWYLVTGNGTTGTRQDTSTLAVRCVHD